MKAPPKTVWAVWDTSGFVVMFTQKTYAKREASETRRCGDKSVVALRYELRRSKRDR